MFPQLNDKKRYDNEYGTQVGIYRHCYYEGTEQISIDLITGYGAGEEVKNIVISEHELDSWVENFKKQPIKKSPMENSNISNTNSIQTLLFETMKGVKDGSVSTEKARAISGLGQVFINSIKVEIDYSKVNKTTKHPFL